MTGNKNKKPRSPPNQEPDSDRNGEPGRGGRGRGRRGCGGRGGGVIDGGKTDDILHWGDGFRGGSPSGSNLGGGGRGRGRGGADLGGFTDNFHGGRPVYHPMDRVDFEIQQRDEPLQSEQNTPGGWGRGSPLKPSGNNPPRGSGGHGGFAQKLPFTSPLSSLWYEERPLLRPIKFTRSVETATLFQEAEELLEPNVQNLDKPTESHAPTADKVSQALKGKGKGKGKDKSKDKGKDKTKDKGKGKGKSKNKGKDKSKDKGKEKGKEKSKDKGKDKGKSKEKDQPGGLRTKEGDIVGHAAPKIGETNVGFMMLASMGWSDGAAVGLSGGLDAPITAVIKKTKLGLGVGPSAKSS